MQQILTIVYLIVIFGVFYFFIIRPQQIKAKEHNELVAAVSMGDTVVTAGGLYGKVVAVEPDTVMLEIAPEVIAKIAKNSIIIRETEEPQAPKA
ncbi:MAG: preprotein translocase subunit YajC [Candidatus Aquicultorales bacterium]